MRFRRYAKVSALLVIGAAPGLLAVQDLAADSFRCGRKVIRTGDSPAALLERCGEPRYRSRSYAELDIGEGIRKVRVEQWHYKLSERSFERIVLLYRGEIVAIETGGR
jgi:hypothetical protein